MVNYYIKLSHRHKASLCEPLVCIIELNPTASTTEVIIIKMIV